MQTNTSNTSNTDSIIQQFENCENPSLELTREAFNARDSLLQLTVDSLSKRLTKINHLLNQDQKDLITVCVQQLDYISFNNNLSLDQLLYLGW